MAEEGKSEDSRGTSNDAKITLEIDGEAKEFGAEDVSNLLAQQASATQAQQKVAPILKALEKYNTNAENFLSQSEGAFLVTQKAIDAGLVDPKTGELITQKTKEPDTKDKDLNLNFSQGSSEEKTVKIVQKAMSELFQPMQDKMDLLEREQIMFLRENTSGKVKGKYPSFSDEDVSQLFARVASNPKKGLWDHAEEFSKEQGVRNEEAEVAFAKKYGINLEEARNTLKEQDDGGGGTVFTKAKKFSFKKGPSSKDDKDAVTPADAMQEHMKKNLFEKR